MAEDLLWNRGQIHCPRFGRAFFAGAPREEENRDYLPLTIGSELHY